jgi:hypothetical protein
VLVLYRIGSGPGGIYVELGIELGLWPCTNESYNAKPNQENIHYLRHDKILNMTHMFTDNDTTVWIDGRKVVYVSRKRSKSAYLPLYRGEIAKLGLTENSFVKAEVARTEAYQVERPASELQSELDRLRQGLRKILDEYDKDTSIRKSVLMPRIEKLLGVNSLPEDGSPN